MRKKEGRKKTRGHEEEEPDGRQKEKRETILESRKLRTGRKLLD